MPRNVNVEKLICDTFVELMEEKSYFDIKVTEIVKHANIARSTFYIYFDSIFGVLEKIEDDFINGIITDRTTPLKNFKEGKTDELLYSLFYIKQNMNIFKALIGPNGSQSFQAKFSNRFSNFFLKLLTSSNMDFSKTEIKMICENISGGRWNMYKYWALHEDEISIDEVAVITKKLIKLTFALLE